jgi:hypothetical protein
MKEYDFARFTEFKVMLKMAVFWVVAPSKHL